MATIESSSPDRATDGGVAASSDEDLESESSFFPELDVSVFRNPTHPYDLDFAHADWQSFANDLSDACRAVFPQKPAQYIAVHALLLNWVEDDLGTQGELVDLRNVFEDQFNFTAEIWRIPSAQSEDKLEQKISQVKAECGGENKLLIVYYGGHGKFDANGRSIWHAWTKRRGKPKSPMLNWHSLQPMLKRAPCDCLIILDCCFAANAARGDVNGVNELLAACGREVEAVGVSDRSFTRNLIRKLRSFGSQPFTVNQLYERLLKDRKRLMNTPGYFPLSGHGMPSICLAPLPKVGEASAESLSATSSHARQSSTASLSTISSAGDISQQTTNTTPMSTPPSLSPEPSCPKVLLAVSLKDDATPPDITQWKQWLTTEAPYDIRNIDIKIESAYLSHSTLVLVTLPAVVWNHLPDNSAYRFIGFVASSSLVPPPPAPDALPVPVEEINRAEADRTVGKKQKKDKSMPSLGSNSRREDNKLGEARSPLKTSIPFRDLPSPPIYPLLTHYAPLGSIPPWAPPPPKRSPTSPASSVNNPKAPEPKRRLSKPPSEAGGISIRTDGDGGDITIKVGGKNHIIPAGSGETISLRISEDGTAKIQPSGTKSKSEGNKDAKLQDSTAKGAKLLSHNSKLAKWLDTSSSDSDSASVGESDDEFYDSDTNITSYSSRAPSLFSGKSRSIHSRAGSVRDRDETDSISRQSSDSRGRPLVEPLERPRRVPIYRDHRRDVMPPPPAPRPRSSVYYDAGDRRPLRPSTYYPGTGYRRPLSYNAIGPEPMRYPPPPPSSYSQRPIPSPIYSRPYDPYEPLNDRYPIYTPPVYDYPRSPYAPDSYRDRDTQIRSLEGLLRRGQAELKKLENEARQANKSHDVDIQEPVPAELEAEWGWSSTSKKSKKDKKKREYAFPLEEPKTDPVEEIVDPEHPAIEPLEELLNEARQADKQATVEVADHSSSTLTI